MQRGTKKLVVLAGPTAVGKTALAVRLAQPLGAQIISADSRQIFRELIIGTAKPSTEELATVKHHFVDVKSIADPYDAGQFGREALTLIQELFQSSDNVILCGGSGLYIKAVCEGFDEMPAIPPQVRQHIIAHYEQQGLAWLQQSLREKDPDYYRVVDAHNPQRLMRALELLEVTKLPMAALRREHKYEHSFTIVKIALELSRDVLYARIDARMDAMIAAGLFEEARHFFAQRHFNALQTVGYREIMEHLEGHYDYDEAVRLLKRNSRRYAKRQLTWFKRDAAFAWFQPNQYHDILQHIYAAT